MKFNKSQGFFHFEDFFQVFTPFKTLKNHIFEIKKSEMYTEESVENILN